MLKRLILAVIVWACVSGVAEARERLFGYCMRGGYKVTTQGLQSTEYFQRTFRSCTVRVYDAGTTTLVASIYSDNLTPASTPLANPFTSASDGYWEFYAPAGRYDVQFTDTATSTQYTWGDLQSCDPLGPNADTDCTPAPPSAFAHNLLSDTHTDTVPYSPPEIGDLPRGNLYQTWERLGVSQIGQVLTLIDVGGGLPIEEWVWPSTLDTCTSIQVNGVESGCEHGINFTGGDVTVVATDDSANDLTNVAITPTGGASFNNIRYANAFPGATGGDKIAAAVADVAGIGTVIAPSGTGTGAPTSYANQTSIIDLRATSDIIGSDVTDPSRAPLVLIDHQLGDFTTFPLTGTVTLTNGLTTVTGVGTAFLAQLQNKLGRAIKLDADGATTWARVVSVSSNTVATLSHNYTGTGGAGAASYQTTNLTFAVRNTVTGGTGDDLMTGESVGLSVVSNRTAGNRGIYGGNFNLSYGTVPTATTGQAIALELDLTNNSGVDDPGTNPSTSLAIISAGTKHTGVGISVLSTGGPSGANTPRRGMFIAGWTERGILLQGAKDHLHMLATPDANPQIGGRDTADSYYLWYIANNGSNLFPSLTNSQAVTSPAAETQGHASTVILNEITAPNANAGTGVTSSVRIAATNNKNWTAVSPGSLRPFIGQPIILTGATGTVAAASSFISNPIFQAGTVTDVFGYYAMAPDVSGGGTVTNKYSFYAVGGAGKAVLPDGLKVGSAQVDIYSGAQTTRNAVRTEVGTGGAIGSLYLSSAGKAYLKVAAAGADTDWERVTTTAGD